MFKDAIIKELNELAKAGIARTCFIIETIREGEFDEVIADAETSAIKVSEVVDMVLQLAHIRGIK